MADNTLNKNLSVILTGVIVLVGAGLSFWLYYLVFLSNSAPVEKQNVPAPEIKMDLYNSISNPKTYGTKVTLEEPGFGRANPFAPYKASPAPATTSTTTATPTTASTTTTAPATVPTQ